MGTESMIGSNGQYLIPKLQNSCLCGSLWSNNALVFYKPHSLAPGGIGTVKNYRHKAIKT
jgi:hypothetical protein